MEFAWLLIAFLCGLGVTLVGLPPLIGFLLAGFGLNLLGFESNDTLQTLADVGITMMLFTIGLKLNISDLIKTEVWAGAGLHTVAWSVVSALLLSLLIYLGLSSYLQLDLASAALIGFALSFSSTVCVVKLLEERGELKTRHGKLSVSILVIQDIIAVVFMVLATGKTPSAYALLLLLIPFTKPIISKVVNVSGHGELLPLTGFIFAFGGYYLFDTLGIKGDLGALAAGMLLASQSKASELAKSLLSFKDILLIGFFLSVGLTALPDMEMTMIALVLCLLLPIKFLLFVGVFSALRLRVRTAFLSSLVLSNFSEFGLIVIALAVSQGFIGEQWLVIVAISASISFVLTSILYSSAHSFYQRFGPQFVKYERAQHLPEDIYKQPENAKVLVMGMGRVGKGAYRNLADVMGEQVWGVDADPQRVDEQVKMGIQTMLGDGEDAEFWQHLDTKDIELMLLALPSLDDIKNISAQLRLAKYKGKIAVIARYEDEVEDLLNSGADKVFNFFTEAGTGFAEESLRLIDHQR